MSDALAEKMKTELKRWKEEVEARKRAADDLLTHINGLLENLGNQPNLDDIRAEASRIAAHGLPHHKSEPKTQYDQIAEFLVRNRNQPMSVRQLADGTGISTKSLPSVLYTSHSSSFVRQKMDGFKNRLAWCLTQEAHDAACESQRR